MDVNLARILERAADHYGDQPGYIDGSVRRTYREVERRVAALDTGLRGRGVKEGDVIAMLMLNSHRHLELWFAIPRGGCVINDLNTRLAPAEMAFILDDAEAVVLVVDDAHAERGAELARGCSSIQHLVYAGDGPVPDGMTSYETIVDEGSGDPARPRELAEDTLAGIFYTGGTTGRPKGAMLTHRNLIENAKHVLIAWGYQEGDVYLHAAPMFHLADGASNYALSAVGGTHVIIPSFAPELALATIEAERVTRALFVPTMLNMVINYPDRDKHDLSSLRRTIYGASPMPDELLRKLTDWFDCEWGQAYGMTEASPLVSFLTPGDHTRGTDGGDVDVRRLKSAGRPIFGVEVQIRRPDGTLAETGEPGEICVRGPNLMAGYWKRPEETAAVLVENGWYRSGDAGYLDENGYLFVVDRVKDMIISGGENVYSSEVENALYDHPDVVEVAVFGVPDAQWGERVHAAVVLRGGAAAGEDELIGHCRSLIAGYKLPRSVEFHDALPKSGAGKILKRDLRKPHWEHLERQIS